MNNLMNNPVYEKAFVQRPDYTLYPKLFSAVKNVENAVRLLAYDNMNLLQSINYFRRMPSIISIHPLKNLLEEHPPKSNFDFYLAITKHLEEFESCIIELRELDNLQEQIEEIYFLIHQAYIELDKADIQSIQVKITSENEVFEDYLRIQLNRRF